jgi:hypothetical protein
LSRGGRFPLAGKHVAALGCGLLLGLLIWSWWGPSSKKSRSKEHVPTAASSGELDLVEYAVRHARSWRVTTVGTLQGRSFQTDQDVFCPYGSHTVTRTLNAAGAGNALEESIETGGTLYAREGTDAWSSQPATGPDKCRVGPMAGPEPLLNTLDRLKTTTTVARGELVQAQGGSCRVWDLLAGSGSNRLASICVDELRHLPYEFQLGGLKVRYTNWNLPVVIEAPAVPKGNTRDTPGATLPN